MVLLLTRHVGHVLAGLGNPEIDVGFDLKPAQVILQVQ